ncbi:uncharacterized protein BCR38DRAFT_404030 [Pseudomassariella vexata]|uniref:Uncharacterized protein n=1 Tax=Pseudomassariella vexata TaxID=1141098 RepID=A0A1Y2EH41_9PEZI|nr:uncharacterized protein BCR38DRAFT_404030 [Pseudomassariella vexata]ORY70888.1 hypothetical protein BCR38DRAFT_404030 [Pseudomassariella vexata]
METSNLSNFRRQEWQSWGQNLSNQNTLESSNSGIPPYRAVVPTSTPTSPGKESGIPQCWVRSNKAVTLFLVYLALICPVLSCPVSPRHPSVSAQQGHNPLFHSDYLHPQPPIRRHFHLVRPSLLRQAHLLVRRALEGPYKTVEIVLLLHIASALFEFVRFHAIQAAFPHSSNSSDIVPGLLDVASMLLQRGLRYRPLKDRPKGDGIIVRSTLHAQSTMRVVFTLSGF